MPARSELLFQHFSKDPESIKLPAVIEAQGGLAEVKSKMVYCSDYQYKSGISFILDKRDI